MRVSNSRGYDTTPELPSNPAWLPLPAPAHRIRSEGRTGKNGYRSASSTQLSVIHPVWGRHAHPLQPKSRMLRVKYPPFRGQHVFDRKGDRVFATKIPGAACTRRHHTPDVTDVASTHATLHIRTDTPSRNPFPRRDRRYHCSTHSGRQFHKEATTVSVDVVNRYGGYIVATEVQRRHIGLFWATSSLRRSLRRRPSGRGGQEGNISPASREEKIHKICGSVFARTAVSLHTNTHTHTAQNKISSLPISCTTLRDVGLSNNYPVLGSANRTTLGFKKILTITTGFDHFNISLAEVSRTLELTEFNRYTQVSTTLN